MSLAVIIVNFRTAELTLDCLHSLAPQIEAIPGARVILVDNGSADGSVDVFHEKFGDRKWLTIAALQQNVGFACGNNRGLELAGGVEHVLFLNSDTIVHDHCFAQCQTIMRQNPGIGAMSCLVLNKDGTPQVTARRFSPPVRQMVCALGLPWRIPRWCGWADPQDSWNRMNTKRDVDWIGGAFMFCRSDVLSRLGGFDEEFFFYGEDYELCHRIHRAGYRIHYDYRPVITHLGGGSSDEARLPSRERMKHMWRGRYLAFRKCYGRSAATVLRGLDLLNYAASAASSRLRRRSFVRSAHDSAALSAIAGRL